MCISIVFLLFVLFYFITFTPKWFGLAMTAVGAELSAILLYKMCKILQFLCASLLLRTLANSVQNSARAESQDSDVLSNLRSCFTTE